jgi:hypothetical protein
MTASFNAWNRKAPRFLLCLVFLASVIQAHPAELHVAKTGQDANSGAADAPFLTINRAAQVAQPGDTVVLHAGIYREPVTPARGGASEQARIVYRVAPGARVVIKGSEPLASWKSESNGVWFADVPAAFLTGVNPFTTRVAGPTLSTESGQHLGEVFLDGVPQVEQPTREAVSATAGTWFAQPDGELTRIWANFGAADPNRQLVEVSVRASAFSALDKSGVNFLTLDGIAFAQTANNWASIDGAQPGAISTGGGTHWLIQNCTITDAKCAAISIGQPGRDLKLTGPNRPAFSDLGDDINAVGQHIIRNNLIQRCGQAGIIGVLHGTRSEIYGNKIEDINPRGTFASEEIAGIRLALAIDTVIRDNLVRRVRGSTGGYGIVLGPLYQGVRITGNVILETEHSPLFFYQSHGPVLVDNNVIAGPGVASGEGVKLRGAEAGVFVQNIFADCAFVAEAIPGRPVAGSSFRPHSLVIKQTIPVLPFDDQWLGNIFIRGGLDQLRKRAGCEVDYNAYMGGAVKCDWGDQHSATVAGDGGFALKSVNNKVRVAFDLAARPKVDCPAITPDFIGLFALTQESIEQPDGRPITLATDFSAITISSARP